MHDDAQCLVHGCALIQRHGFAACFFLSSAAIYKQLYVPIMSRSYLYTRQFIDREVKVLNGPLVFDDAIHAIIARYNMTKPEEEEEIDESKVKNVIFRCNILLKRHNRNIFPSQIINQIVQQILKNEQIKLVKVNENFANINSILQPILLPTDLSGDYANQLTLFNQLINELPELKYLSMDKSDSSSENLLEKYDAIRLKLIKLNEELIYKYNKLLYLKKLKLKLISTFNISVDSRPRQPDDIYDSDEEQQHNQIEGIQANLISSQNETNILKEINRFKVLVEKLSYKLQTGTNKQELHEVVRQLNKAS